MLGENRLHFKKFYIKSSPQFFLVNVTGNRNEKKDKIDTSITYKSTNNGHSITNDKKHTEAEEKAKPAKGIPGNFLLMKE